MLLRSDSFDAYVVVDSASVVVVLASVVVVSASVVVVSSSVYSMRVVCRWFIVDSYLFKL